MIRTRSIAAMAALLWLATANAAPAQSLLERLERRLNDATAPPAGNNVERPQAADNAEPGYLGLTADDKDGGVEVIAVRAGGPAEAAGVLPGDRITSVGGVEIGSLEEMGGLVNKLPAGSRVDLVVNRRGREVKAAITLGARERAPVEELPGPNEEAFPEERRLDERATLGVRALPISADLQRRYGLTVRRGAVIDTIQPGSPADRDGLPLGAAIVAVDGARVDSPDDLAEIIGGARPGDIVEISFYQRDQVFRKRVRLGPAGVVAPDPREGRPLLRRLERALDGEPLDDDDVIRDLQAQIDAMQRTIETLEARVAALERGDRPRDDARPAESAEETLPDLRPPLKPLEP